MFKTAGARLIAVILTILAAFWLLISYNKGIEAASVFILGVMVLLGIICTAAWWISEGE